MLRCRHFHRFTISIGMVFRSRQVCVALTSRTVVHNLMAENIAVDAEMVLASFALVPARLAGAFGPLGATVDALAGRWESRQAAETLRRVLLAGSLPRHFDPVAEGEEMVVGTRQMRG